MEAESLSRAFAELSTPLIADAALRLKIPLQNQSARHSAGDTRSTSRGPGAAGQTFWQRRCFSGSDAGRSTRRSFGNR